MESASAHTETRLPWGDTTITITGGNSGVEHITVDYDGDKLNIIDFLNNSLLAEYAALYEAIMSKYEARLKNENIFALGFPETAFTAAKLSPASSIPANTAPDTEIIKSLLTEYNNYLSYLKNHFSQYETQVQAWFDQLAPDTKK